MTGIDDVDDGLSNPHLRVVPSDDSRDAASDPAKPAISRNKAGLAQALQALEIQARYNSRQNRTEFKFKSQEWGQATALIEDWIREEIESKFTIHGKPAWFPTDRWRISLNAIISDNTIDPFTEWLYSLPDWDRKKRLNSLLSTIFKVDKSFHDIASWCSRFAVLGAVQRTLQPGMKLDEFPVLIGGQGAGKSTCISHLLPPQQRDEWFNDGLNLAARQEKRIEHTLGKVLIECSEMTGATKGELTDIKAYVAATSDVYRQPYDRHTCTIPRRFIVIGTSNEDSIPNDPSGNRRFVALPVEAGEYEGYQGPTLVREYLDEFRADLWAEALYMWRHDEHARLPMHLADQQKKLNEMFRNADPIEDRVADKMQLEKFQEPFKLTELMDAMEMATRRADMNRISVALRNLGYINSVTTFKGQKVRWWRKS